MNKLISWLGGIFALQVILVAGFVLRDSGVGSSEQMNTLVDVDKTAVDEVVITDADDKQKALLKRSGDGWLLPEYENLPARSIGLGELLDKLMALNRYSPVANTSATIKRFKVADDDYEKKVELKSAGKSLATLYFGTSPSYKKVHARLAGESTAYVVELSDFELKSADKDWLNKVLLAYSDNVDKLEVQDLVLQKDEQWHLQGLAESETLDTAAADNLVSSLKQFSVEEVLSGEAREQLSAATPQATLTVFDGDKSVSYSGYKLGDDYVVKSSLQTVPFKVAEFQFNKLFDISRDTFVKTATTDSNMDKLAGSENAETEPSGS